MVTDLGREGGGGGGGAKTTDTSNWKGTMDLGDFVFSIIKPPVPFIHIQTIFIEVAMLI